jgi:hypothetical protein
MRPFCVRKTFMRGSLAYRSLDVGWGLPRFFSRLASFFAARAFSRRRRAIASGVFFLLIFLLLGALPMS